jgi:hypothetical protein
MEMGSLAYLALLFRGHIPEDQYSADGRTCTVIQWADTDTQNFTHFPLKALQPMVSQLNACCQNMGDIVAKFAQSLILF